MKQLFISLMVLALTTGISACMDSNNPKDGKEVAKEANKDNGNPDSLKDDTKFVLNAADGGMMEVQLGTLAQTNASSPQVKAFGQKMIEDRSKANSELKELATGKRITIPLTLSDKNQSDYADLAQKKGVDFDKAYSNYMVKDHKDDISEFQKEGTGGKDAEIKAWAAGKVATLQMHLQMAQSAADALK